MTNPQLQAVHHIAIICSNYEQSKKFYTEILGYHYRDWETDRKSTR